jgi:hypothetical protein
MPAARLAEVHPVAAEVVQRWRQQPEDWRTRAMEMCRSIAPNIRA